MTPCRQVAISPRQHQIPQTRGRPALKAQLDDLVLLMNGKPNRLATIQEALRVQILIEGILAQ